MPRARKTVVEPEPEPIIEEKAAPKAAVTISAMVNAGGNGTVVKLTGAGQGGHRANLLAITPEQRTQTVGDVSWDGDEHEFHLPYVAEEVRIMEWLSKEDADEIMVQPVEDYTPTEPPVEPPPEGPSAPEQPPTEPEPEPPVVDNTLPETPTTQGATNA